MADLLLWTSTHSFQKTSLEGGVPWFQLALFFDALDQTKGLLTAMLLDFFLAPTPYGMIKICILDGSVMQQIVPVISRVCVRCFKPHEGVPLQVAPHMAG